MARTPRGSPIGIEDPYAVVDRCDHCTDRGHCRLAIERPEIDWEFADRLAAVEYACPVADPDGDWAKWSDCPHLERRTTGRACHRCGLEARRDGLSTARPLLEEHHLRYPDQDGLDHEITVALCRWCHAKVHDSWAALTDDVNPDPEAIAERESRRASELAELSFPSASDRAEEREESPSDT